MHSPQRIDPNTHMPEELGIALVIIVAVGWILIKILQAFGRAIGETLKGLSDARSARNKRISAARLADKKANFDKNKHSLSQYLTVTVPDQLDSAETTHTFTSKPL